MSQLQGTHSLKDVIVTIDGAQIDGAGDGDFVSVEYNAPIYNTTIAADGDSHRSLTNDKSGTITIQIMQTSARARRILEGVLRRHELGLGGTHTISITALATGEQIVGTQAYPEERPTYAFGADSQARDYQFRAPNIERIA